MAKAKKEKNGWKVMIGLYIHGPNTAFDLSELLWDDQHTGSKSVPCALVEIERMGMVARKGHKTNINDNKVRIYYLTDRGKNLVSRGPEGRDIFDRMYTDMNHLKDQRAADLKGAKLMWHENMVKYFDAYQIPGYSDD